MTPRRGSRLAQAQLLRRVQEADPQAVREAAAADPADVDAQMAAADLDLVGGHVEDAFGRLVDAVRRTAGDERDAGAGQVAGAVRGGRGGRSAGDRGARRVGPSAVLIPDAGGVRKRRGGARPRAVSAHARI